MNLQSFKDAFPFPDPSEADPGGLLAYGGDLCPERLLSAYARGIFPWYESDPILWYSPDPRGVLAPSRMHVARSLQRTIAKGRYDVRFDTAFEHVIRSCAMVPRPGQSGTWITPEMADAYTRLFELGYAHSVEAWEPGGLVGGLYGVSLGTTFFGESMFTLRHDASKVALVRLAQRLRSWGFRFIDCQVPTDHLARFGAESWSRERFLRELDRALQEPTRRGPWTEEAPEIDPHGA